MDPRGGIIVLTVGVLLSTMLGSDLAVNKGSLPRSLAYDVRSID